MTDVSTRHEHPPPPDHRRPYEVIEGLYISGHPDYSHDFLGRGVHAVIDLEGDVDTSVLKAEGKDEPTLYLYWQSRTPACPTPL
jgi:hypothetical protein